MPVPVESDKHYWHQYIQEYEKYVFSKLKKPSHILEFGVLKGASILWLSMRFPTAKIIGVDITPTESCWPQSSNIEYIRADQGDRNAISYLLSNRSFDLIIDDGSHIPEHQTICLVAGIQALIKGGFYILEDAHTSHPRGNSKVNSFNALLAIQHLKTNHLKLTDKILENLSTNSFLSKDEARYLFDSIQSVYLYKRTVLPLKCHMCGSTDFNYATLKCECSVDLYFEFDSMAFMIQKGGN